MEKRESSDFINKEFTNQNKDVAWLCKAIQDEGYELGPMEAVPNSIEWLNELLRVPDLFEKVAGARSLPVTGEIEALANETAEARKRPFGQSDDNARRSLERLNRLVLELAHPPETPKMAYELVAVIRTSQGNHFLQEYENMDSFKRDMKEHREYSDWGLLVRSDQGKVVSSYLSSLGDREKIGMVDTEPMSTHVTPEGLSPQQSALRDAAIRHYKSNKAKAYISEQMQHVNAILQIGEALKPLFDKNGQPPPNAPLEDIIAERKKTQADIVWLETICLELKNVLTTLTVIEDGALDTLSRDSGRD